MNRILLLPPGASSMAHRIDALFIALLLLTGALALGVALLIVYFAVKYRRGSRADRSNPPERSNWLELSWTVIPTLIFLALFLRAADLYAELYRPPAQAMPIYVVAKQWMWTLQHSDGRREIDELHVPIGVPVKLTMTSQDVIHSFYLPAMRIKQDVLPGRYTSIWFMADRPGEYKLLCSEFCGTDHAGMLGRLVVMTQADYARWQQQGSPSMTLVQRGRALFSRDGCSACHAAGSTVHAPSLAGLYGSQVLLADGRLATADEAYLRDAILLPRKQLVAGYDAIMPAYDGQIGEEDLLALIAYIRNGAQGA